MKNIFLHFLLLLATSSCTKSPYDGLWVDDGQFNSRSILEIDGTNYKVWNLGDFASGEYSKIFISDSGIIKINTISESGKLFLIGNKLKIAFPDRKDTISFSRCILPTKNQMLDEKSFIGGYRVTANNLEDTLEFYNDSTFIHSIREAHPYSEKWNIFHFKNNSILNFNPHIQPPLVFKEFRGEAIIFTALTEPEFEITFTKLPKPNSDYMIGDWVLDSHNFYCIMPPPPLPKGAASPIDIDIHYKFSIDSLTESYVTMKTKYSWQMSYSEITLLLHRSGIPNATWKILEKTDSTITFQKNPFTENDIFRLKKMKLNVS